MRRLRCWLAAVTLCCMGCVTTWPVEPGDPVALGSREGLLVVHVRTNVQLRSVQISGARAAEDVPEGMHVRLIGVTAGSYRWSQVAVRGSAFRFPDADRLRFRVEPGVINYVGMVDIERGESLSVSMNTIDRTAMALAELRTRYPDLVAKYPIVYSGPARHEFLRRYPDATAHGGREDAPSATEVSPADSTTEALFRTPALLRVALNPSGTLSYSQGFDSDLQIVTVRNTRNGANTTVFSYPGAIDVAWVDDDTMILQADEGRKRFVIDLQVLEYGVVSAQRKIAARGWLVDPLPLAPDAVLWADWDGERSFVYRLPISELVTPRGQPPLFGVVTVVTVVDRKYEVARLSERVIYWIPDGRGVPRVALTLESEDPIQFALLYRGDDASRWREIGVWSAIDPFPIPVGIASDGHDLLVISSQGSDTAALRRYRVDSRELGEVIFAHPTADISDVVFDYYGREVIAVSWEEAGIRKYHYLDPLDAAQQSWLDRISSDKTGHLTSRTADRRLATILVSGSRDPGDYYLVDASAQHVTHLGSVQPWLNPAHLAPVAAIDVPARDGMKIEAFLTLPSRFSGKRPPLVVMPHGGPIGIQDTREFNPVVQSLAAGGFAVLQVNYRGSGGRGTSFLEAGMGVWGRGIEDDIEAAIDHVVAAQQVDANRVCIFGGSYGGYSALIGITRRPQRYRCAAAVAAPTDLLLLSSDFADGEDARRVFARIVGDPDADRERLIEVSPAYRAADMNVPVLLIQGDRDRRVDPEHAYRMRAMLEAQGKPYEWMLLEGADHDPNPEQWKQLLTRVHRFLDEHLKAPTHPATP